MKASWTASGVTVPPEVTPSLPKIRDLLLTLLSSKTFDDVRTPEGKQQLREEIIAHVNQVLERDAVLVRSGDRINHLLFPCSGAIAFIVDLPNGQTVANIPQGLDVVSLDFSPSAQRKGRALAKEQDWLDGETSPSENAA